MSRDHSRAELSSAAEPVPSDELDMQEQGATMSQATVLAAGGSLRLRDWLSLPWFLPAGFQPLKLRTRGRSIEAVGRSEVYRFYESQDSESVGATSAEDRQRKFLQRWNELAKEIADNAELAPNFILGVRVFSRVEDEPHWLSDNPSLNLDPLSPPTDAAGFALVTRRLADSLRLDRLIAREGRLRAGDLQRLVRTLVSFHRRSGERIRRHWFDFRRLFQAHLRVKYVEELPGLLVQKLMSLDPREQMIFTEAVRFVCGRYERSPELFLERGEHGRVVDGHGALRASNIYLQRISPKGRRVLIVNRSNKATADRIADCLDDLTELLVDLELLGLGQTARQIRSAYEAHVTETEGREIFRVAFVSHAIQRLMERSHRANGTPDFRSELWRQVLSEVLDLPRPFLVGLQSPAQTIQGVERMSRLADELQQLTGRAEVVNASLPGETSFARSLSETNRQLLAGGSVVAILPADGPLIWESLCGAASELGARAVFAIGKGNAPLFQQRIVHMDLGLNDNELAFRILSELAAG